MDDSTSAYYLYQILDLVFISHNWFWDLDKFPALAVYTKYLTAAPWLSFYVPQNIRCCSHDSGSIQLGIRDFGSQRSYPVGDAVGGKV